MVPKGWKIKRLDEISLVKRGKFSARPRNDPQYYDGDIPFVQTGDVSKSGVTLKKHSQHLNLKGLTVSTLFPKGTILITIAANIGDCTIAPYEVAFPDSLVGVTVDTRGVHNLWLLYYLKTKKETLNAQATQNAQKNINLQTLNPLPILLPPLAEQKKIARILSTWDKAIETVDKLIENNEQQKKALMQLLLTGKKRLPGFSGEWKEVKLGDVAKFSGGSSFKPEYQGQGSGDYPFVKVNDMNLKGNEKYITTSKNWISQMVRQKIRAKIFHKDAIIFAKVGAALLLNRRRILTQNTCIDNNLMAATCSSSILSPFLYQILLNLDFSKYVQEGAIPSINQQTIGQIIISCPALNEQQKISQLLETVEKKSSSLVAFKQNLQRQKQALMQQLLTGKRRVKIDEPELTEALA